MMRICRGEHLTASLAETVDPEVPAFVIFSKATLRGVAHRRLSNQESLPQVFGIDRHKASDLGEDFRRLVCDYCAAHNATMEQA